MEGEAFEWLDKKVIMKTILREWKVDALYIPKTKMDEVGGIGQKYLNMDMKYK